MNCFGILFEGSIVSSDGPRPNKWKTQLISVLLQVRWLMFIDDVHAVAFMPITVLACVLKRRTNLYFAMMRRLSTVIFVKIAHFEQITDFSLTCMFTCAI